MTTYTGRIKNQGAQKVEAPVKSTPTTKATTKQGGDIRTGGKK